MKGSKTTFQIGKAPFTQDVELLDPPNVTVILVLEDLPPSSNIKPDADITATFNLPFG